MNRKTPTAEPRSPARTIGLRPIRLQSSARQRRARDRRAREDVTLQLQLPILTPQPDEFVTLGRRQAQISRRWLGFPPALAAVGLRHPVADSRRGGLERAGQIIRITTGADQLDHLAAELARVGRTGSGYRETPHAKALSVSTKPGQSHSRGHRARVPTPIAARLPASAHQRPPRAKDTGNECAHSARCRRTNEPARVLETTPKRTRVAAAVDPALSGSRDPLQAAGD